MPSANICGERVKQGRENRSMGQTDLAAALSVKLGLNIDQSDVSEIERGVRGVKDYELDAIAYVLSVSVNWLLRGGSEDARG